MRTYRTIRIVAVVCLMVLLLCSCKPKTIVKEVAVPVETIRTEVQFAERLQRDSIYLHDSIYIDRSKDTLLIERWHTAYKDRVLRDTIRYEKTDTITIVQPIKETIVEQVEVERPLSTWQRVKQDTWLWLLLALLLAVGYIFRKPILSLINR